VLVDGAVVDSCLVPICQVEGASVITVEGLAHEERLNALQAAFLETGGAQCGICTPGMLMAGEAFLASGAEPTDAAIQAAAAAVDGDIDPPTDIHATAAYRRHLARVLAARVLGALWRGHGMRYEG
jgi:xanthine dehydrogenase iron-sulfur cluster and FAD-binding subunit A